MFNTRRAQLRRALVFFGGALAVWQVFFPASQLAGSPSSIDDAHERTPNSQFDPQVHGQGTNKLIWKPQDLQYHPRGGPRKGTGDPNGLMDPKPMIQAPNTPDRSNLPPDPAKETILAPPPAGHKPLDYRERGQQDWRIPAGRQGVDPPPSESECPGLHKPGFPLKDTPRWLRIADDNDTFVYSAYYETRFEQPKVRIVAITDTGKDHPKYCQVWYSSKTEPDIVRAVSDIVPETHSRRYAPFFYLCGLPTSDVPYAVSLVFDKCYLKGPSLPVLNTDIYNRNPDQHVDFTVCVTPLNFHYNKINQLVEFIEVNRLFGANKFVFYNHTTGPDVDRYLTTYMSDGSVDVLPWKLPIKADVWPQIAGHIVDIHYFAQLAALNDCLYRYMHTSTYLVFIDLDEFIIPKTGQNWLEMLQKISSESSYQEPPVAFIFKNVFFRCDWPADDLLVHNQTVTKLNLQTLLMTKRENQFWMWKSRSKYIVDPMGIDMVGVHNIWQFLPNVKEIMVEQNQGVLHHYRNWENPNTGGPRILDRSMHTYMDQIISATKARHQFVEKMSSYR